MIKLEYMILPDVLKYNLDIVFCGTAVSDTSAIKQAYYAGPGNQFYPVLYKANLIPNPLQPENYEQLLQHNLGLTDLVKLKSGNDNVLENDDFDILGFKDKILNFKPKIVCFNGKGAAAVYLFNDIKKTKNVQYGWLNSLLGETRFYVAPSTSGNAKRHWDESFWFKLKQDTVNG